jgi:hypothetical protein
MKFFTFPLLVFMLFKSFYERRRTLEVISYFSVVLIVGWSSIYDMSKVNWSDSSYRMAQGIFHVFGINSINNWFRVILTKFELAQTFLMIMHFKLVSYLIFFAVVLLFTYGYFMKQPFKSFILKISLLSEPRIIESELIIASWFFGIPFIGLFLQGMNYDQKLLFCILPSIALVRISQNSIRTKFFLVSYLLALWLSCFWPHSLPQWTFVLVQLLGDIAVFIVAAALTSFLLSYIYLNFVSSYILKLRSSVR